MKTYFAPPERLGNEGLKAEIRQISNNPVVDGLMNVVSGLLAVLNEHRQILAVNETFLKMLGIDSPQEVLGLRPGESVGCVHAHKLPGGCGTSEFCSSCGAAIAILASMESNQPAERNCVITAQRNNKLIELFFKVRSFPLVMDDKRFVLLFLSDVSKEQQWAAIEHVFFHDLNNLVQAILGRAELIQMKKEEGKNLLAKEIHQLALRLTNEITIQRNLFHAGICAYQPLYQKVLLGDILKEIQNVFSNHVKAGNKQLILPDPPPQIHINTDFSLIIRILVNMVSNAFEATHEGGQVRITLDLTPENISFYIWNEGYIPDNIARRIFQRNFSTKNGMGRGLGTYSMKYFGEKVLGGEVDFVTSLTDGTLFRFTLPV